jgi:hypothetical protein
MPVLSIGGDKSLGGSLGEQMKLVATNVTVVMVKNSGHWILEEQSRQTIDASGGVSLKLAPECT